MPTKRYKLLQNHPYAEKGTIVEEYRRSFGAVSIKIPIVGSQNDFHAMPIPLSVEHDWLEEVKEEPTCSKEFADALELFCLESKCAPLWLFHWLKTHTTKEE